MSEDRVRDYYERELRYLRQLGEEFGRRHDSVAKSLRLDATRTPDPHVERLLDGFAFLTARIHIRLDDDQSEIAQSLLQVVYPDFMRPAPSMCVAQLHADEGTPTGGFTVQSGSRIFAPPARGLRCQFRTCGPAKLWPLRVTSASWARASDLGLGSTRHTQVRGALRVTLATIGDELQLDDLSVDRLRFFLSADYSLATTLFELLDNNLAEIVIRSTGDRRTLATLPRSALRPAGFDRALRGLAGARGGYDGHRLLTEIFAFPEKFLFMELDTRGTLSQPASSVELLFLVNAFHRPNRDQDLRDVKAGTIRLGCVPVVNLFESSAKPITLDHKHEGYLLRAEGGTREYPHDIYSVDAISVEHKGKSQQLSPLHGPRVPEALDAWWRTRRQPSSWRPDGGTDVEIAFVDPKGLLFERKGAPARIQLTVSNGGLPSELPITEELDVFELHERGMPVAGVRMITRPSEPLAPTIEGSLLWPLVSALSLNFLSLVDEGGESLRNLLALHNRSRDGAGDSLVHGIWHVESFPDGAFIPGEGGGSFVRGRRVQVDLSDRHFSGGEAYVFASVLERFLAQAASLNSFCALEMRWRTQRDATTVRAWPPRVGNRVLL